MKLITFDEAIEDSKKCKKRHAFLGNGFSISCRPDIFVYGKLLEQADFSKLSDSARNAFKMLNTSDFEHVIKTLRDSNKILYSYPSISEDIHKEIENDASGLKEILVQTIARSLNCALLSIHFFKEFKVYHAALIAKSTTWND